MINSEYRLAIPWYDSVEKQNRYKRYCQAVCDFQLLYPVNTIPPFQLSFDALTTEAVVNWYIRCEDDDSITIDLTPYISLIDFDNTLSDYAFYTYDGTVIDSLSLPCGTYYMELVINNCCADEPPVTSESYYSEVITIIDGISDLSFTQSAFTIFSLWRYYTDIEMQTRNKSVCGAICDYYLMSGNTELIPFQFRFTFALPMSYTVEWSLIGVEDGCEIILDSSLITISSVNINLHYATYNGDLIDNLACGKYYSVVTIDGTPYYSELIWIEEDVNDSSTNYILQESGFKILLETGFGLLQE